MKNLSVFARLSGLVAVALVLFAVGLATLLQVSYKELVNERKAGLASMDSVVMSVFKKFYEQEKSGALTREEAQDAAKLAVESMRYGQSGYFWINDTQPAMVMHPIKPALVGKDLSGVKDPTGKHLFVEMVKAVKNKAGEGFVDYYWPKPGAEKPVLKYSHVAEFAPWGWIVGTGVYADDLAAIYWENVYKLGGVGVVAGLALIAFSWFVVRGVTGPLNGLKTAMARIAKGDGSAEIKAADRGDEIGEMAKALLVLRDSVNEREHLHVASENHQRAAEEERMRKDETLRAASEKQNAAIEAIGKALENLASGDLTVSIGDIGAEYEKLRADFNRASGALHSAIQAISESGSVVDSNAVSIDASANELSHRTEQQAASLEEAAAALEEITTMVATASDRATEARDMVARTKASAEESGETVRNAVDAMGRIEESSGKITQIIGVIDEIAFQTNLLALNAGVEAARAGEAGRGFAVVAQEVRELAQRSAGAAKEIKDLINASSGEIKGGVTLVRAAGDALLTIGEMVNGVNEHVETIATAAREQATGLSEVNTTVNHMDQMTQQNAAMVNQTTSASAALANESTKLRNLLQKFKLSGYSAQAGTKRAA